MTAQASATCGLCSCTAHEVDQLVQLGQMGFICLSCLEQVANAALPLMALATQKREAPQPPENNIVYLRPRTCACAKSDPNQAH